MMTKISIPLPCLFLLAISAVAQAGEDTVPLETMVITANRTETKEKEVGSSLTVISADEIQKRQVLTVAEALRLVPGIDVINSGGLGHMTNVYTRGAGAGQTLVLVDMVEMNDPSDPTGAFDFSNLMADNIERIEVLRGGESALYGSDAIGGVINIITKKGKGDPKFSLSGQGGTYNTFKTIGSASGQVKDVNYALTLSETQSHGFSAADAQWGSSERDLYRNTSVDGRIGWDVNKDLDFGASVRYNNGLTGLDNAFPDPPNPQHPGAAGDALGYTQDISEVFTRGFSHLKLFDSFWEQTFAVAYSSTTRQYSWPSDPYRNTVDTLEGTFIGDKIKGDWQNILHLSNKNDLMLGVEDEEDRFENIKLGTSSNYAYNTQGYYLTDRFTLFDRSFTTASVRYTDNSQVGSSPTWSITEAFLIDEIGMKLKANYGTGFKVPTLVELYSPPDAYGPQGNPNLKPETSNNWDIGFEQEFINKHLQFGATYFNNQFNNLIQYKCTDPVNYTGCQNQNISAATAQGAETFIQIQPVEDLILRTNYTYDYTRDLDTNTQLVLRPQNKVNFEANYQVTPKANFNFVVIAVGEKPGRYNSDLKTNDRLIPGYAIANLAGSYTVTKNVKLFSRIDNLFNKHYQEGYGYGTSGLAGYGGVTLSY
jgi:vitamin B12 transporter